MTRTVARPGGTVTTQPDDDELTELVDADFPRVDLVGKGANGIPRFLIAKQGQGAGVLDPGFVRELVGKQADPADGDDQITLTGSPAAVAALIHKAAQTARARVPAATEETTVPQTSPVTKAGPDLDDSPDGMDTTMPLAAPDGDAPGDPNTPGSPAWEAIDAATATKWTAILARTRVAVDMLAERELLEAASADPDDAENAWDLQDVCCAIDYAISVLAPFAVAEQSQADSGAMDLIGKAMAGFDLAGLDVIEGLGAVRKSGRVLSSSNEAAIRGAVESLTKVLASLPAPIEKDAGMPAPEMEADMPLPEPSKDVTADLGETDMGTEKTQGMPAPVVMAKAAGDKTPMMVVYNQAGQLVGIADPADITPVANAEADPSADMDSAAPAAPEAPAPAADGSGAPAAPAAATDADMTPAPSADAGTPTGAVDDDDTVAKQDGTITLTEDVLKGIVADAVTAALGALAPAQDVAKSADVAAAIEVVKALEDRLRAVEEQPALPKVFTNGAVPPAGTLRGQDQGTGRTQIDVAKAKEDKASMYGAATPADQNTIANDMQARAIQALAELHRR
jgi:hypothetical protein